MKKLSILILIVVVIIAQGWLFFGRWHTSPLHGKLKIVTVTMKYFSATATNANGSSIFEKTVTIEQPADLAAIENSMTNVQNHSGPNSVEGLPNYRMKVGYTDGTTQIFVFTKTEWGGSGFTPRPLLEELEKHGL